MNEKNDTAIPVTPLRTTCLLKIASFLWRNQKIEVKERRGIYAIDLAEITEIPSRLVMDGARSLGLPKQLTKDLFYIAGRIGSEINNGMQFFPLEVSSYFMSPSRIPRYISLINWTVHGGIDMKPVILGFVQDSSVKLLDRYTTACNYSLEDEIRKLWTKLWEDHLQKSKKKTKTVFKYQSALVRLWSRRMLPSLQLEIDYTYELDDSYDPSSSENSLAFQYSYQDALIASMYYFWAELTEEEKIVNLKRIAFFINRKGFYSVGDKASKLFFLIQNLSRPTLRHLFKKRDIENDDISTVLVKWPNVLYLDFTKTIFELVSASGSFEVMSSLLDHEVEFPGAGSFSPFKICWISASMSQMEYILSKEENVTNLLHSQLGLLSNMEKIEVNLFYSQIGLHFDMEENVTNLLSSQLGLHSNLEENCMLILNTVKTLGKNEQLLLSEISVHFCEMLLKCGIKWFVKCYLKVLVTSRDMAGRFIELRDNMIIARKHTPTSSLENKINIAIIKGIVDELFPKC